MNEGTVIYRGGPPEIGPGLRLNDTYEIVGLVGEGGLSQVYRAFNLRNRHPVAIKFLRADLIGDADTMELFQREASILAELSHDAIVKYLGFSFDPLIRREYLVMEFVEGVSLEARMRERPLSAAEAMSLKTRLADGLSAAHRRGAVHRDMSPDNVILPGGDIEQAKIIDFGIAKALKFSSHTVIGTGLAGKFSYMSPEQVLGAQVTEKSDVYGLGLVLAAALRGEPLDMGKTLAELAPKRSTSPQLPGVDASLRPLIEKMLRPAPAERPGMDEVASWRPGATRPPPAPAQTSRTGAIAALLGAFVFGVSLVATGYVFRDDLRDRLWRARPEASPTIPPAVDGVSAQRPANGDTAGNLATPTSDAGPTSTANSAPTPALASPSLSAAVPTAAPSPFQSEPPLAPPTPSPPVGALATTVAALPTPEPPRAASPLTTLDLAFVGRPFHQALPAFESGDPEGLRLTTNGSLPEGLEFKDIGRGVAVVEGTPSRGGTIAFEITAKDRDNRSASMRAIAIVAEPRIPAKRPVATKSAQVTPATSVASTPASAEPSALAQPQLAALSPIAAAPAPTPVATQAAPSPLAAPSLAELLPRPPPPIEPSPTAPPTLAATALSPPSPAPPAADAAAPPRAPATKLAAAVGGESLAALLKRYDGGDCWVARAVERQGERSRIEAMSGDAARLTQLSEDVARQSAATFVSRETIDRAQCPVLALARAESVGGASKPRLELATRGVGGASPLAGEIQGVSGRTLAVLVVRGNGKTASLKFTAASADVARFSLDIARVDDEDVGHKLAVAVVVSEHPLRALGQAGANQPRGVISLGSANDLFPALAAEVAQTGAWADVEFVTLTRP